MQLNQLTIKQAHNGLIKKEFSSVELTKACLERIKQVDEKINAFITVSEDVALSQAALADEKIAKGEGVGILTGIPFSVKDAICTKGIRSTGGAKILDTYVPPFDATVISRIREQGGVIIGKTNCDAFGHGASNENSDYGPVHNPWDLDRVSGGSSGGSAASVATDMCIYSIGEDTGGSIRQPAAFCNIFGLKPSYGRNSRYGIMPMASSLDTVGPMAKCVEDLAILMEVMAGLDKKDSTTLPIGVPNYTEYLDKDIKGIKIGLPKEYFTQGLDPEIEKIIKDAAYEFEKLGVSIKEVSLPMTKYAVAVYYIVVPSEDSANLSRLDGIRYGVQARDAKNLFEVYTKSRSRGFPAEVKRRIMLGTYALSAGYYDAYYKKAQQVRTKIIEDFNNVFEQVDILLTSTSPVLPFKIGERVDDPLSMYLADAYTVPASVAGINALSVPAGFVKGLPVGMQLIAQRFSEERLLNIAYAYESVTNWHKKKPDV